MQMKDYYRQVAYSVGVGLSTAIFFYLIFSQFRRACHSEADTLNNATIDNACSLIEQGKDACLEGFNNTWQMMLALYGDKLNCSQNPLPHPGYEQLYPMCKPDYTNNNLTGACLNGLDAAVNHFIGGNQRGCDTAFHCWWGIEILTALSSTAEGLLLSLTILITLKISRKTSSQTDMNELTELLPDHPTPSYSK